MERKPEVRKISNVSVRAAVDGEFSIEGIAAAYGCLSQDLGGFREQIARGAFTRTLRDRRAGDGDCKCLFNHDASKILGRLQNGTLQLFDKPEGLGFRCKLDPNNTDHRALYGSIKRGDISDCSFAFALNPANSHADEWDEDAIDEDGQRFIKRTLNDVDLLDVSVVTYPAYDNGATNVGVRSAVRVYGVDERFEALVAKYQRVTRVPGPARSRKSLEDLRDEAYRRDPRIQAQDRENRRRAEQLRRELGLPTEKERREHEALIAAAQKITDELFQDCFHFIACEVDDRGVPKYLRPATDDEIQQMQNQRIIDEMLEDDEEEFEREQGEGNGVDQDDHRQ